MYTNLEEFVARSSIFKKVFETRNVDYKYLEPAFDIVKAFIIRKKRIIYGGMSIDMALKSAGAEGIYDADAVPDYDFMSPVAFDDSIELADELFAYYKKAGMADVGISSINALHPTTRRVRVNFIPVADITYIPKRVYDDMPTIGYKGFLVIHPWFQRLDMHRAFSNPLENPPREVVFFRSKKDIKRFTLLDENYPIVAKAVKTVKSHVGKIPVELIRNNMTGGLFAYAVYYKLGGGKKSVVDMKWTDKYVEITAPVAVSLNILTENIFELRDKIGGKMVYRTRFLEDLKPRSIEIDGIIDLHDTKGHLLPYQEISLDAIAGDTGMIKITTVQTTLMYLLAKYFESDKKTRDAWLSLYVSLQTMATDVLASDATDSVKALFELSSKTYGSYNWSYPYVLGCNKQYAQIAGSEYVSVLPHHGYYPSDGKIGAKPVFDPSGSWVFQMDGSECNEFDDVHLKLQ